MKKIALMVAVASLIFSGIASAELVSGKVQSTDPAAKSVEVMRVNPATGAEEKLVITVQDQTTFSGVQSLEQLKQGDEVWAEVEQDKTSNNWKATSIEVGAPNAAEAGAAKPAAEKPAAAM